MAITEEMLEEQCQAGLYNKTMCLNWKGGNGNVTIYNDICIRIPKKANASGKIVMDKGASLGLHTNYYETEEWQVLAGAIEFRGKVYVVGEKLTFRHNDIHYANNVHTGKTIIGFVMYLQT